jgi:hypothetical protein
MNNKKFTIHKARDGFDKAIKKHETLFQLPMKMLLISKSQVGCGKSNIILNMLVKPEGYKDYFDGDDIYIFNPSTTLDKKFQIIIEQLDIPSHNIFSEFDNDILNMLIDNITEQTEEEKEDGKIKHKLIIIDDCSFGGKLKSKRNGAISRLFSNGRHLFLSVMLSSQKLTDIPPVARENATVIISGNSSNRQLDVLSDDCNLLSNKKQFVKMFRDLTDEPYSFMCIDFCRKASQRYLDKNFEPVDQSKYV